jgi:tetratricopeptide (TPR) repeat protein
MDFRPKRVGLMKKFIFIMLLSAYVAIIVPFSSHLKNRPIVVKLGYMPEAEVLKLVVGDHSSLFAQFAVVKVLFYFGSLVDKFQNKIVLPPEYFNMFKTLQTSVKLDPYNMDTYYFTQAAFTWEVGRIKEVNDMLEYGMKYRTWDYNLPFYAGFNAAYFLKDYKQAAVYMQKAAELSRIPMLSTLAARYFYESGRNDLGIIFLENMRNCARDESVKRLYDLRKKALLAVQEINKGIERFRKVTKKSPGSLSVLVAKGFLADIPQDPYGGTFYIDDHGVVRSTSKFAFGSVNK